MGVLYEHWRTDINECFYVGISWSREETRPWDLTPRNPHHGHVVNKLENTGYSVDVRIQAWDLSKDELCELEPLQISYWRALIGDRLTNISLGGEGGEPFNYEDGSYEAFCKAVKEGHAKRSLENKINAEIKRLETLSKRTEEDKERSRRIRSVAVSSGYKNQTPEKKIESSKNRSIAAAKAHAEKTPEKKKADGEAIRLGRIKSKSAPVYKKPFKWARMLYNWHRHSVKPYSFWGS
jgi:hypothetical protein